MRGLKMMVIAICAVASAAAGQSSDKRVLSSGSDFPLSPGISVGGMVYLSGMLARDFSGDIRAQTRETLERIGETLEQAGSDLAHVTSTTVFLKNAADFPAMNEVYGEFFSENAPARTSVMANLARPTALIEIEVTAVQSGGDREVVLPDGWMAPTSPYNYGIKSGDTLFLSGLVSRNGRDNAMVEGDVATQVNTIMANATAILGAADMALDDIVETRVYLRDVADFTAFTETYRSAFTEARPTRATVKTGLPGTYDVEITFVAVKDEGFHDVVVPARADGSPGRVSQNLSPAVRVGSRLWISGSTGVTDDNHGDVRAQTTEVLSRLSRALTAAGYEWSDVVRASVYVSDMEHYAGMNEAYRGAFVNAETFPVRATIEAPLVNPNGLVEIALFAVK